MEEKVTLAKCGMDCTACRFAAEWGCPGCMYCLPPESEGAKPMNDDEECEVGRCCAAKEFEHCGKCPDFPCGILKEVSLDKETGDGGNRMLVLKDIADREKGRKELMITAPLASGIGGLILGIITGCITGRVAAWIFAGIVIGLGLGAIIFTSKEKYSSRR